jgi:hypothetical protein
MVSTSKYSSWVICVHILGTQTSARKQNSGDWQIQILMEKYVILFYFIFTPLMKTKKGRNDYGLFTLDGNLDLYLSNFLKN